MTTDIARMLRSVQPGSLTDDVRAVVAGGLDLHTHPSPDITPRFQTVAEAAADFASAGISGFVVKSHVVPTTTMAAAAGTGDGSPLGSRPLSSITLNQSVGGLNPEAVETAARMGASIVWLPTKDSAIQRSLSASNSASAVEVCAEGRAVDAIYEIVDLAVDHGLALATGHLGVDEIFTVLDVAADRGLDSIIITHPLLPQLEIPIAAQAEMASRGALIEHTLNSLATGKVSLSQVMHSIERCGTDSTILTGDLGQPEFGGIAGGLPLWARLLLDNDVDPASVRTMVVGNTRRVVSWSPASDF